MLPRYSCRRNISAAAKARSATADNHDLAGRIGRSFRAGLGLGALLPDENAVAFVLDVPGRQRVQRRRAGGFAAAQIETGVMPGTTDAFAGHEAFGERPVIMAAMRADREDLRSRTHQQHFILADMAEQRLISEFGQGYAL